MLFLSGEKRSLEIVLMEEERKFLCFCCFFVVFLTVAT